MLFRSKNLFLAPVAEHFSTLETGEPPSHSSDTLFKSGPVFCSLEGATTGYRPIFEVCSLARRAKRKNLQHFPESLEQAIEQRTPSLFLRFSAAHAQKESEY